MKMLLKLKQQGKEPDALLKMPVVPPGFGELLRHFNRLSFSRSYGFGNPNPIDFISIDRYNQAIARLDLDFFLEVIQMLDSFYLRQSSKESDRKAKGTGKSK